MVSSAASERREGSSRPKNSQSQSETASGVQERKMMTVSTLECASARMLQ